MLQPKADAELLRLLARGISRSAPAGNGWRRYAAAWREMPHDGVAIMADRPLVRFFWSVLDALDYSLTQARLWVADAVCGPMP